MVALGNLDIQPVGFIYLLIQALFGSGGSFRDGAAKVGLNMLTKAIASCAVDGHIMKGCSHEPSLATPTALTPFRQQTHGPLVEFMRAAYIVDNQGVLWFSHAEDVRLRILPADCETAVGSHYDVSTILSAAKVVALELQNMLHQATSLGVSVEHHFAHFDLRRNGYVVFVDKARTVFPRGERLTSVGYLQHRVPNVLT